MLTKNTIVEKMSKNEEETKTFMKKKVKELITIGPALQEMLK